MTIDRDALRRLAEGATPGPWSPEKDEGSAHRGSVRENYGWEQVAVTYCGASRGHGIDNAVFIAAANPRTVLALLDALDEAERFLRAEMEHNARHGKRNLEAMRILGVTINNHEGVVEGARRVVAERDEAVRRERAVRELLRRYRELDKAGFVPLGDGHPLGDEIDAALEAGEGKP